MNTNIKLKDLLNYPFKETTLDGLWELEHVINELGFEVYSLNTENLDRSLFKIRIIYDNPHQSDESSYRYLLFFKNEFCCLYGYTGDRGRPCVRWASKEKANEFCLYLHSLEDRYEKLVVITAEEVIDISDDYTTFSEKDGIFYYSIDNPQWSFRFRGKVVDLTVYYMDENETLHQALFVKLKTNKESYHENLEDKFMILETADKKQIEVPYGKVFLKALS